MPAPRLIGRTILAAAILGATFAPAIAQAEPTAPPSVSALHLTVSEDRAGTYRDALLTCEPSGGTHPASDLACQSVSRANGNFGVLPNEHANAMCPLIYQPVTARAQGRWQHTDVNFSKTYPNACVLKAETGVVFDF
jgi:hypothetical protein